MPAVDQRSQSPNEKLLVEIAKNKAQEKELFAQIKKEEEARELAKIAKNKAQAKEKKAQEEEAKAQEEEKKTQELLAQIKKNKEEIEKNKEEIKKNKTLALLNEEIEKNKEEIKNYKTQITEPNDLIEDLNKKITKLKNSKINKILNFLIVIFTLGKKNINQEKDKLIKFHEQNIEKHNNKKESFITTLSNVENKLEQLQEQVRTINSTSKIPVKDTDSFNNTDTEPATANSLSDNIIVYTSSKKTSKKQPKSVTTNDSINNTVDSTSKIPVKDTEPFDNIDTGSLANSEPNNSSKNQLTPVTTNNSTNNTVDSTSNNSFNSEKINSLNKTKMEKRPLLKAYYWSFIK